MAEVYFEQAAVLELMDDLSGSGEACSRAQDERANDFDRCRQRYSRLHTEAEQKIHYANAALREAEDAVLAASSHCASAEQALSSAEDEYEQESAMARLQDAQAELAVAEAEQAKAQARLARAQAIMFRLTDAWETHGLAGESALERTENALYACQTLFSNGNRDLGAFVTLMGQARSALYSGGVGAAGGLAAGGIAAAAAGAAAAGAVGAAVAAGAAAKTSPSTAPAAKTSPSAAPAAGAGRAGLGWCSRNSMRAVTVGGDGTKSVSMRIGEKDVTVPCTKSGMARIYREARRRGDRDLEARAAAMFEIETLREDLELTAGEDAVQLGGYHRDVKGQDPAGYESHHIPSRSVQDADADWLPALSISKDDHKDTFSYAGRQRRVYQPVLPGGSPKLSYQQEMSQEVGKGSSGYVAAVRDELYDLRISTGHKYDGGISAYLDAVIDMLASRGLPGSR